LGLHLLFRFSRDATFSFISFISLFIALVGSHGGYTLRFLSIIRRWGCGDLTNFAYS
jgi:hypothetical protein